MVAKRQCLSSCSAAAQTNGEMRPGKKGISLSVEQFEALMDVSSAVTEALEGEDVAYSSDLSSKCDL